MLGKREFSDVEHSGQRNHDSWNEHDTTHTMIANPPVTNDGTDGKSENLNIATNYHWQPQWRLHSTTMCIESFMFMIVVEVITEELQAGLP